MHNLIQQLLFYIYCKIIWKVNGNIYVLKQYFNGTIYYYSPISLEIDSSILECFNYVQIPYAIKERNLDIFKLSITFILTSIQRNINLRSTLH